MQNKAYILIHKRALSEDAWTYGNWRQYVAQRDNGGLQCCRHSLLPMILTVVPAMFLALAGMACLFGGRSTADINPIPIFIAFMALGLGGGLLFGDYRLMVPVGPICFNGRRRFWGEDDQ